MFNKMLIFIGIFMLGAIPFSYKEFSLVIILVFTFMFFVIQNHISITLVHLEILMMLTMVVLVNLWSKSSLAEHFLFVMFSVSVVGASAGLAILVYSSRNSNKELSKTNF